MCWFVRIGENVMKMLLKSNSSELLRFQKQFNSERLIVNKGEMKA